jgi:hypothetical protein
MSRDAFSFEPREEKEPGTSRARTAGPDRTDAASHPPTTHVLNQETPESSELDRAYFVRDSELQTLAEIGTFRAITDTDLARFGYGGDTERMEREIRRLREQSLITERIVPAGRNKTIRLLALTKAGARVVRGSGRIAENQRIYHGFAKPREARHDADLYRLYHAQVEAIVRSGGRPTRVRLDYELKSDLNRDLSALSAEEETGHAREEIAERHGLMVVDGKIPLPDMRIEYDSAEMEHQHLDLELATRNYRPRALAEKAKAGFSLYARSEDASRLRRVLDEREITAEILSL